MLEINLSGRVALVGGASQGIGACIAHELAKCGAQVILLARNKEVLEANISTMEGIGHHTFVIDYAKPVSEVEKLKIYLNSNGLEPDIYIHNTGGPLPGMANAAPYEQFEQAFTQHLISGQLFMQLCLPYMKRKNWGRIVNIISTSVKAPLPNLGVSNTIRGAVAQWSKTLANELGPFGITCNNVLPGATSTGRLAGIIDNKSNKTGKSVEEITKEMLDEIPAGRFAFPDEIAYAAAFLCSDLAAYINGINLPVDGGRTPSL